MGNIWREPIFDRTIEDVDFAIRKIEAWKKYHTHAADVRVEEDALIVQDDSAAYVNDDDFVIESEGKVYVDENILRLDLDDVYDLKGCFNLSDLNRIEGNVSYLAENMERLGYFPNIHGKRWSQSDMPTKNDMMRIIENIRSLISAYYFSSSLPSLPETMLTFSSINAIEENLCLLKELLDCMQSSFKKVGTIKSGSRMILPIRR